MRKSELVALTTDAVVQIGSAYWLRIPVAKLHNDRYIPLHPQLKELLDSWLDSRPDGLRSKLMFIERGRPMSTARVDAAVDRVARAAGLETTSHPTACATRWPPRPSTEECRSKRSPRCSAIAP